MCDTTTDNMMTGRRSTGFTLIEVLTALAILALVSSSVLVVVDRCLVSASDSSLRMEAFLLARENMEKILASDSVEETVDFGNSEKYPDMSWQTVIESFSEPVSGKMWIRAVCSAEYLASTGEKQEVKLEHWITELTDQQANQLAGQPGSIEELTVEQLLATEQEAAEYAGVDVQTIQQWVEDGLVTMDDGGFLKHNIDVYVSSEGKPTAAEKKQQVKSIEELAATMKSLQEGSEEIGGSGGKDPVTGLPRDQLEKMGVSDVMKLLKDKKKR